MEKVVVITGPTGVGKTALSIKIAKEFNGEIINCDASQFRKDLNIGTAKITREEMQEIKHHLIDNLEISSEFSVKEYQDEARKLISEINNRCSLPIMVGGTGLYISSTLYDYQFEESKTIDESIYDAETNESLHFQLQSLDYQSAEQIHPNNRRRVIRAIEIAKNNQKLLSENKDGSKLLYDALIICLNCEREILYNRINQRFDVMIQNGWIDECKNLISKGVNLSNVKDIGYSDIALYIEGKTGYTELAETVKKKTRNYAKRQLTWFRNKLDCHFVEVDYQNYDNTINKCFEIIDEFLKK